MIDEPLDLASWLDATQSRRDELDAFAVSAMPCAEDRDADIEKAIAAGHDAGKLAADSESYLTHAKAVAMYDLLKEDLNSKQVDLGIKDRVRDIQRLADGLSVCNRTLQNRIYSSLNARRSRL